MIQKRFESERRRHYSVEGMVEGSCAWFLGHFECELRSLEVKDVGIDLRGSRYAHLGRSILEHQPSSDPALRFVWRDNLHRKWQVALVRLDHQLSEFALLFGFFVRHRDTPDLHRECTLSLQHLDDSLADGQVVLVDLAVALRGVRRAFD